MYRKLDNMEIKEFDDFLKFAKKRENENFKVFLKSGIDIFQNEEKISMIWILINSARGGFVRGDVVYEIKNPGKRDLTLYEKIEKIRNIYWNLKEEFKQTEVYEKHKLKKDEKQMKERERRLRRKNEFIAKLNKKRIR